MRSSLARSGGGRGAVWAPGALCVVGSRSLGPGPQVRFLRPPGSPFPLSSRSFLPRSFLPRLLLPRSFVPASSLDSVQRHTALGGEHFIITKSHFQEAIFQSCWSGLIKYLVYLV